MTKAERAREAEKSNIIKEMKEERFSNWRIGYGGVLQVDGKPYGDYTVPFAQWKVDNAMGTEVDTEGSR